MQGRWSKVGRVGFIRLGRVTNPASATLTLLGECAVNLRHNLVAFDKILTCALCIRLVYLLSILTACGVCLDCCMAGEVEHRGEETSRRAEPEVFGRVDIKVKLEYQLP